MIHTSFCVTNILGGGAGSSPFPFYEFNSVANGSSNNRLSILEYDVIGNFMREARYVGAGVRTSSMSPWTLYPFIWTARHTGAAAGLVTARDGGSAVGAPGGTGSVTTSNALYFNVGTSGWQGGNVTSWNGRMSEIITYNRILTTAEIQLVEGYLAWKWGVTSNVISTHPYYTWRPFLRAFTPCDVTTLPTLWFDAANLGTMASNTSNLTTWSNLGVYSCNAVSNVAGSNTIRTGVNTQNRLNVASVPANGHMTIPATIFTNQARSFFTSFKVTTAIGSGSEFQWFASSNTMSGGGMVATLYNVSPGGTYRYALHRLGTGDLISYDTTTDPLNNFYQIALVNDGTATSNNVGTWNGSTMGLTANSLANYVLNEPYSIAFYTRTTTFDIGDMILYNVTLSSSDRQRVEGYLAWKWGITSLMPAAHPYRYVMPMSPAFNPRVLSNCLFWFDAADLGTIASNTSNVTTWSNKGIYPANAESNASFTTGRTGINTINSLNVVNFPAGASLLFPNISTGKQTRSVFVVTRNLTQLVSGVFQGFLNAAAGYAAWQDFYLTYDNGTSQYVIVFGRNAGDANAGAIFPNPVSNPLNVVNMYGIVLSTSLSSNIATQNGSTMTTQLNQACGTTTFTTTSGNAVLATAAYNTAQDMAEYIQFDYELEPSDRYRVEGYLAWKWGLASSLPAFHPFKKVSP